MICVNYLLPKILVLTMLLCSSFYKLGIYEGERRLRYKPVSPSKPIAPKPPVVGQQNISDLINSYFRMGEQCAICSQAKCVDDPEVFAMMLKLNGSLYGLKTNRMNNELWTVLK